MKCSLVSVYQRFEDFSCSKQQQKIQTFDGATGNLSKIGKKKLWITLTNTNTYISSSWREDELYSQQHTPKHHPELEHPQPGNVLYLRGITLSNFLAQNTEYHRAEEKINIHLFQK